MIVCDAMPMIGAGLLSLYGDETYPGRTKTKTAPRGAVSCCIQESRALFLPSSSRRHRSSRSRVGPPSTPRAAPSTPRLGTTPTIPTIPTIPTRAIAVPVAIAVPASAPTAPTTGHVHVEITPTVAEHVIPPIVIIPTAAGPTTPAWTAPPPSRCGCGSTEKYGNSGGSNKLFHAVSPTSMEFKFGAADEGILCTSRYIVF